MRINTENLVKTALIAAIYAVITILFAPISYGPMQVRISEALTVLPFLTPLAIPGLFLGCIVANIYGGYGIYDIVFGSLATLLAAYFTYKMPKKFLAPLPPVIVNGIIIGLMLHLILNLPLLITVFNVAVGEFIACYIIGYPLLWVFERIIK